MKENFYMNVDPDTAARKAAENSGWFAIPKSKKENKKKMRANRTRKRSRTDSDGDGNNNNNNNNRNDNGNGDNDDGRNNGNDNGNGGRRKVAEKLVDLISKDSNLLFKDQYGVPFANVFNTDHYEVIRIGSGRFKRYLGWLYYESENKVANTDAVNSAVQLLQGRVEYQGKTIPLSLRVAWHNGDIIYDMTNEKWQYIKISKKGYWQIINDDETTQPIFCRYNQVAQVTPDRSYEPDIFDMFLQLTNLKEKNDRILLKVYIVSLFIPEIPHAILVLHGGQGSAKSTLQTMIKLLVDPAKPKLLTINRDTREFIQQLAHNYVAFYDNLKKAPGWLSDECCKAVTGVGSTKRELYTDDDDIIYEYKRCLGFSGINASLIEPDALDRSLMIELLRIDPKCRKDEKVILSEYFKIIPKLLGYIFDILTKAIQIRDTIKLNDLPRMADFALWGEAIIRAMGYKDLEFINAYYENIGKQNIEVIENNPLGHVIIRYIAENQKCEGSASELLDTLETYVIRNNIKIDTKSRFWPKAANSFTRRLNQISSNLLEGAGIEVRVTRIKDINGKANMSSVKIWKIPPISPLPPSDQNYEGNSPKSNGDIKDNGGIISPSDRISPSKDTENRAQNRSNGDNGGIGDIFRTKRGGTYNSQSVVYQYQYSCYFCAKAGKKLETNDKSEYLKHMGLKHHNKPAFPIKTELKKYGLTPQGKPWEI